MAERRSHLILVGLILAALVGVALLAVPGSPAHKKPTLGLDLRGGLEVVLKAKPPKGHPLTKSDLSRSVTVMRNRIDKLGVSEPVVTTQGSDEIVIELAGVHNINDAINIIGKTAQLELYDLETSLTGPSISASGVAQPRGSVYALLAGVQSLAKQGTPTAWYLFDAKHRLFAGPAATRAQILDARKVKRLGKIPKTFKLFAVPVRTVVISCGPGEYGCPNASGQVRSYYLFKFDPAQHIPQLTGTDLKLSGTRADVDPDTGLPEVLMHFTGKGGKEFQKVTQEEYVRGGLRHTPQHFAIVLDREIKSFPQIDYTDSTLSNGISGGNARITGLASAREAKNLALVLQTGALPVSFRIAERTDVSATLGKDSLNQAKRAALYGLLVVAIFLLLLYRFLGLVAVIGLAIYAAFLYAAILIFNVTLTLPGFAGLILTIGVAADANVVVFERIKEEVRAGKSVRAAVNAGYAKGFHTILDANVVTAITAMVLFAVASAGVKGFALMLLIGTVISLITAVAATRAMLGLLAGFRWFDNPRFMGAHGQQSGRWLQIDFMRRRFVWLAISGLIIVVGATSLSTRGLNLGIDFKGGTQVTFKTPQATPISDVRTEVGKIGKAGSLVQGTGKQFGSESYKGFQIRLRTLTRAQQAKLTSDLQDRLGAFGEGTKTVSASFGRQIARSAVIAIIFSLFLVVLYVAVRFDVKFAVPVILAMIHDVIICVGVYSLTGREVSTSTVAAVLTVLGYSIYDTIIIFDRIRENIVVMRRHSFATIANTSLWETIRRSLATTFITLLPVGSLFVFGGATLKDFAFALLVGILSGAYSSIFIAAPLLTIWKEREPDYARRKDAEPALTDGAAQAVLEEAEAAAAAEPAPELLPVETIEPTAAARDAKRERRRQRRRSRPHGRAR
ncbi:MAG: protein translocase subunit SecD [Actinobacteria bacterium]|nr:MAG: protein translocase subunit SecD [Actinomycetota bacterium]